METNTFWICHICSGWPQEQGRDSGGVLGPIWSLPGSSSRPHLSDAHLVISFCPSPSNLVRGAHIWSRGWRGSLEMESLCHCLTTNHVAHAVCHSAKYEAGFKTWLQWIVYGIPLKKATKGEHFDFVNFMLCNDTFNSECCTTLV